MGVQKEHITNLHLEGVKNLLEEMGQPRFRYKQLLYWVYQKRVGALEEMTNISKAAQTLFAEKYSLKKLPISYCMESKNKDAVKFGLEVGDKKEIIESVILYDGKRRSLCVSTQLGCNLGCVFCETGKMGFKRNLTQHEILGQIIAANDYLENKADKLITNIVFMGMGEPLMNFDTFLSSVKIIMDESCFSIGGRKITVSTAGIVPSIQKLIQTNLNISLAISLNSYNNEKRNALMPINKKYPIEELVKVAKEFHKKTGQGVTFEYVLIAGENDTDEAIDSLVKLFKKVPCKINVIPLNPSSKSEFNFPSKSSVDTFASKLTQNGLRVVVRKSRGQDIGGACGQLAGRVKRETF